MSEHAYRRALRLDGSGDDGGAGGDGGATLVLAQRGNQLPEPVHWGAPLPRGEDLMVLANAKRRALSGGALDALAPLSLVPEEGRSFLGAPGLEVVNAAGTRWLTAFEVDAIETAPHALTLTASDEHTALRLTLHLAFEGRVLTGWAEIENTHPDEAITILHLAAPALPVAEHCEAIMGFGGRWTGEFDAYRSPWTQGRHVRQAREGRTSHEHFPGLLALGVDAGPSSGEVWGFHLGWSGGHVMLAEELADGRRQVQFGALLRPGEMILGPGERWTAPTLHAAYSDAGLSGIARAFQGEVRRLIGHQKRPRPVTCNSWEAVYFEHDLPRLAALAEAAARLGAERFVLDDGWFGKRDDETSSLGDWIVDTNKWPDGLTALIDRVHGLGMEFGLWVEPEMVSPNSELYRAHPDWVLHLPHRPPLPGRNQFVLDLARREVFDHLYQTLHGILADHAIAAIKWDHNRALVAAAGGDGRPGVVRQTEAFYALLEKLSAAHPHVEFETCASGGGRIDFAVLARTGRVWLSDSNDALERMRQQQAASLFLPPEAVGSHVGPRVSHTSGRMLPMATRAWTAAARHMGFEVDLTKLADDEAQTLANAVTWHKANRDLLHDGVPTLLKIVEPDAYGELVAARDGTRFAAFLSYAKAPARASVRPVRLAGLSRDRTYRVRLANPEVINWRLCKAYASPILSEGARLSGAALMGSGLQLPLHMPGTVWVLEGRVDEDP